MIRAVALACLFITLKGALRISPNFRMSCTALDGFCSGGGAALSKSTLICTGASSDTKAAFSCPFSGDPVLLVIVKDTDFYLLLLG